MTFALPQPAGPSDPLAAYGLYLNVWRTMAFDLPFAWASSVDMLASQYMRQHADHCENLRRCGTWPSLVAEQMRYTREAVQASAHEAQALARDVDLVIEQASPRGGASGTESRDEMVGADPEPRGGDRGEPSGG